MGVDTGGTFTDLVTADGVAVKVPSTPDDPGRAVRDAVAQVGGVDSVCITARRWRRTRCSSGTGATVALVTTEGHRGRASRSHGRIGRRSTTRSPIGPSRWCRASCASGSRSAGCRRAASMSAARRRPATSGARSKRSRCACCTPTSTPRHEHAVGRSACSTRPRRHRVVGRCRPSSASTSAPSRPSLNAYLRPGVPRLPRAAWRALADEVLVLTSAGGLVPARRCRRAAGARCCCPARRAASAPRPRWRPPTAMPDAVTFDMGGTSHRRVPRARRRARAGARQRVVAGLPGAAAVARRAHHRRRRRIDRAASTPGGALAVGPAVARAPMPGRRATGAAARSRRSPTPTWCSGASRPAHAFARPRPCSTSPPPGPRCDRAGVTAEGVVAVVDTDMDRRVRAVTVERGVDPRGLALVAFGGAGPLHACALADALGMAAVIVPPRAGVLSAVGHPRRAAPARPGALVADAASTDGRRRACARASWPPRRARLVGWRTRSIELALDCRYAGQSHELTVPRRRVRRRARGGATATPRRLHVEVVALRAVRRSRSPVDVVDLPRSDA